MRNPKIKPLMVPNKGPSNGPVRLECRTLEKVIAAGVPGIGYIIKSEKARRSAVQTVIKAILILVSRLLFFGLVTGGLLCKTFHRFVLYYITYKNFSKLYQ
jgi:hypothetical protein